METQTVEIKDDRLTVKEAAGIAGVHRVTIANWMARGVLKFTKTKTGRVRIESDDLRSVLSLD